MCNGASHVDSFPEPYFDDHHDDPPADLAADTSSYPSSNAGDNDDESEGTEADDESQGLSKPLADSPQIVAGSLTSPSSPTSFSRINQDVLQKYKALQGLRAEDKELHLRRIAGLDVQESVLKEAIESTAPQPVEPSPFASYYSAARERWEDLRVEIWQGSLDVYNEAFDNFEGIIMTEVVEHLYDKALHKFPDIVFGDYRPRIVVVTTPNHDFNKYLELGKRRARKRKISGVQAATAAVVDAGPATNEGESETKKSIKDPTGRTNRRFRDDDHKFEWTEAEFKTWVDSITSKYDYDVTMTGVGSLRNFFSKGGFHSVSTSTSSKPTSVPPLWVQDTLASVPDATQFFATQIAVFHRKFAYESERTPRSPVQAPLAFYGSGPKTVASARALRAAALDASPAGTTSSTGTSPGGASSQQQHTLLKSHHYKASPHAGHAKTPKEIRKVLDELMREKMRTRTASIRELWGREDVAQACGGHISKIVDAIIQDPSEIKIWDIEFRKDVLERGHMMEDAVFLVLKDFVEPPAPDWGSEGEDGVEAGEEDEPVEQATSGVQSMWHGGDELDDYDDEDDDDDELGLRKKQQQPRKTKKQLKAERREQTQLEAVRKAAERAEALKERVWEPEEGDDTWDAWDRKLRQPVPAKVVAAEREIDWDTTKTEGQELIGWGSD